MSKREKFMKEGDKFDKHGKKKHRHNFKGVFDPIGLSKATFSREFLEGSWEPWKTYIQRETNLATDKKYGWWWNGEKFSVKSPKDKGLSKSQIEGIKMKDSERYPIWNAIVTKKTKASQKFMNELRDKRNTPNKDLYEGYDPNMEEEKLTDIADDFPKTYTTRKFESGLKPHELKQSSFFKNVKIGGKRRKKTRKKRRKTRRRKTRRKKTRRKKTRRRKK